MPVQFFPYFRSEMHMGIYTITPLRGYGIISISVA